MYYFFGIFIFLINSSFAASKFIEILCNLRNSLFFQKYEVEFLLQQQWQDPRLSYGNQSKYEYLNGIHHQEDVWLPDTYFIMHGDFKTPLIPVHFALKVFRNGTIVYYTR